MSSFALLRKIMIKNSLTKYDLLLHAKQLRSHHECIQKAYNA